MLATIAIVGSAASALTLAWFLFISETSPNDVVANQHRILHLLKHPRPRPCAESTHEP